MSPPPAQLPARFLTRLAAMLDPHDRDKVLTAMAGERATAFRINTLLAAQQPVLAELHAHGIFPEPVADIPGCFRIPVGDRRRLTESPSHTAGHIYIQNPASMLAPLVLDPRPGQRVLDLCAAPGSKTLQMAAMMENQGWISAVEPVRERFHRLRANVARHGARIVHTYQRDGTRVWRLVGESFDRVLVDAPCSSEGRFSLCNPDSYAYWSEKKIREMAKKQKRLLYAGLQCVKPGGRLLYCTCTMAPEENEAVVAAILRKFAGAVTIVPIDLAVAAQPGITAWAGRDFPPAVNECRRILPDDLFEGFFLCLFEKQRSTVDADLSPS